MKDSFTHNGITATLTRTETEPKKGKDGKPGTPVAYWHLDVAQFAPVIPDNIKGASEQVRNAWLAQNRSKVWEAVCALFTDAEATKMLQSRLDVALKSAQMKQGDDVYTMEEKLTFAVESITSPNKRSSKSPLELANDRFTAGVKALDKTAPDYATKFAALMAEFQARCTEIAQAAVAS
jgi:hypothetical protein